MQCLVNLFEVVPYIKEHFQQLINNSSRFNPTDGNVMQTVMEKHAKLVVNVLHEVVTNIDALDSVVEKLAQVGEIHCKAGVEQRYLDILGPIFCNAVRPLLLRSQIWNNGSEEAWMAVFRAIASAMRTGYNIMEMQLSLKPTDKCIIVATWHSIFLKHMTGMGKTLFIDMFRVEPNVLHYFEAFRDSGIDDLALSRKFQTHGMRVMNLVKFVVENLEKPTSLSEQLYALGQLHARKGIKEEYLDLMGPTFCQAIRLWQFRPFTNSNFNSDWLFKEKGTT